MVFERHNIRLGSDRYVGEGLFFITVCCEGRQRYFLDPVHAQWVIECLRRLAAANAFAIHAYCVMPDHIHLLARGTIESSNLLDFLKRFKQQTAYEFKQHTGERLWQKKFYDHIVRPNESAEAIQWYIWMNPVRLGLVSRCEDYQWSGSFTVDWKGIKKPASEWVPPWKKP